MSPATETKAKGASYIVWRRNTPEPPSPDFTCYLGDQPIPAIPQGFYVDIGRMVATSRVQPGSDSDDSIKWRILELVRRSPGIRMSEVADQMGLDLTYTVELIRAMRARGYIGKA